MMRVKQAAITKAEIHEKDGDKRLYSVWGVSGKTAVMMAENIPTDRMDAIHKAVGDDKGFRQQFSGSHSTCRSIEESTWEYTNWYKIYGGYSLTQGTHIWEGYSETIKLERL